MPEFVETLESRRLLSAVTLAAAEAKLAADFSVLAADAKNVRGSVVDGVKTFAGDVKALHLKSGPLKSALQGAVASAKSKFKADLSHIIGAGFKDGKAVVSDVIHITLIDAGNPAKIAKYQKRLAVSITTLQTLETPLVAKLASDIGNAMASINGAVQAIIAANGSDPALQTDWTALSGAFQSAQNTLVPEMTNIISDLDALSTAT